MASPGKSRRDLLRSFGIGALLDRSEGAVPAAERRGWRSENPPLARPVIGAGQEAEVLALLGPLASTAIAGYALGGTVVGADRIEYGFVGPDGAVQVLLLAHDDVPAEEAHASSQSFRVVIAGDAPAEARAAVGDAVATEVWARDHGQLWRRA